MRRSILVLSALAFLAGCNTMIAKPYQEVVIDTPDVEGVDCILETPTQKYRVIAPGSTQVERSRHALTITCEKGNYFTATKTVEPKIRMGWSALNVFNGVIPGTAYDIASNSVHAYPEIITMDMIPDLDAMERMRAAYDDEPSTLQKKAEPAAPEPTADGDKAFDRALKK